MDKRRVSLPNDLEVDLFTVQNLIIGSGAAGLNCAEHLHEKGMTDTAVVTDKLGAGTSNNSGSDKQTYYKMGIFGDVPDSPMDFAHSLYDGGMMHGDLAYVEALGSAPEFFHLVRNGVNFPYNRYGAFVGYKTDHDPRQRATSAGPRTSMQMFEQSLSKVKRNGTEIFDGYEVIAFLTTTTDSEKRVVGAVALDRSAMGAEDHGLVLFNSENIMMATGGPGEMYETTVYPPGQIGNHGLALEIGAVANNLGESQYGLASTSFRWNLSGTYQQVIPCYYSTEPGGGDERYFLNDYYKTMRQVASNIFLKGYQWPFHASRLQNYGSSIVDYAVAQEVRAGREVWMDFTRNPIPTGDMDEFDLDNLDEEAHEYLHKSGATQHTPFARLEHMNPLAIDIYDDHGIDLRSEPLPVAVCAQHNNGGLKGDIWWESNIKHLFPIGEVNGSHGVRPGGSALNSGQVGGLRAAQYITNVYDDEPMSPEQFVRATDNQIQNELENIQRHLQSDDAAPTNEEVRSEIQHRMSMEGAFLRSPEGVEKALREARQLYDRIRQHGINLKDKKELNTAFQNEHLCLTHIAFLQTIKTYIERGGGSRGGYLIEDPDGELQVETEQGTELPHRPENKDMREELLETVLDEDGSFNVRAVERRPLPEDTSWYETTWSKWRDGEIYQK